MAPPLREMLTSTEPEHCNDRVYRQTQHWGILPHKSHHPLFNGFFFFLQLILLQVHFQLIFLIFKINGCVLFYLIEIIIKSMLMGNIIIVGGFFNVLCTHQYVSQMRHAWEIACACLCRIDVLTDCDAISELISSSRSLRREGICHVDRQLIF